MKRHLLIQLHHKDSTLSLFLHLMACFIILLNDHLIHLNETERFLKKVHNSAVQFKNTFDRKCQYGVDGHVFSECRESQR